MPYFTLDHSDGRYMLGFPVSDEEGPERVKRGETVFFSDEFMKAREVFVTMDVVFQEYFRMLSNESYVRAREDELRDVEDSERMGFQRRIQKLEFDLRHAQDMERHERRLKEEAQHELFELEMSLSIVDEGEGR